MLVLTVWLAGTCGSCVALKQRRGEDSKQSEDCSRSCETAVQKSFGDKAHCEADHEAFIELPTLEGGPRQIPTVTILSVGDMVRNRL